VCCSVLQCVAVCCSVLQCVAVCCSVLQCVAVCCSVLQCVVVCCSVLQCVAVCCRVLQCVAAYCGVLRCVAVLQKMAKYIKMSARASLDQKKKHNIQTKKQRRFIEIGAGAPWKRKRCDGKMYIYIYAFVFSQKGDIFIYEKGTYICIYMYMYLCLQNHFWFEVTVTKQTKEWIHVDIFVFCIYLCVQYMYNAFVYSKYHK